MCARPRLFKRLDAAAKHPVIWVQGPAGAGKTTLLASWLDKRKQRVAWYQLDAGDGDIASFFYYMGRAAQAAAPRQRTPLPLLTPEHLPGIQVFTRRYFEEFFHRLKAPAAIVFDDYQNVPPSSNFHDVFAHALETIPKGVTVVVLSRTEPPAALARLCANNAVARLDWDDLRLTTSEARDMLRAHGHRTISERYVRALQARTEGWAAGVVLLMAWTSGRKPDAHDLDRQVSTAVFNYFASQIFDKADPRTQRFLLAIAHLPRVTARLAQTLTGVSEAAQILDQLVRHHYFTQKQAAVEPAYQLHALFREFLLARAQRALTDDERRAIQHHAADLLLATGETESAAAMLIAALDWNALAQLVVREAMALISTGRAQTLESWILAIPDSIRADQPWLLFWLGICRLPFDPPGATALFRSAFRLFEKQGDPMGTLLCWSRLVEANMIMLDEYTPLDELIDWYYARGHRFPFPSVDIEAEFAALMVSAMSIRRITHPDMLLWAERALTAVRNATDPGIAVRSYFHLIYFHFLRDAAMSWQLVEEMGTRAASLRLPPLIRIHQAGMTAFISIWSHGYTAAGARTLDEAMETARRHDIHVQDAVLFGFCVWASILRNDRAGAFNFLKKMRAATDSRRRQVLAQYHCVAAWCETVFGNLAEALRHAEIGERLTGEIAGESFYFGRLVALLTLTNIYCGQERYEDADRVLALAGELATRMESATFLFGHGLAAARLAFARRRDDEGLAILRRTLVLAREQKFVHQFWWYEPSVSTGLFTHALAAGIEPAYVQHLIRAQNPPAPALETTGAEHWPWPVKVHALGEFGIEKDGAPLNLAESNVQKPLAMLKALIAFGGRQVAETKLTDALWPDADGDRARHSYKITLHRLRKLLGREETLVVRNGKITIDTRLVWVDALGLNAALHRLDAALGGPSRDALAGTARQCTALYGGAFLDADPAPWALHARERLRDRYLRLIARAADTLMPDDAATAVTLCEKAVDADPLNEAFYQRLMRGYQALGRHADALDAFSRCRDTLQRELNVSPSPGTDVLYRSLAAR